MIRALEQADQRAAFTHGWDEFPPFGLIIHQDQSSQAVFAAGNPGLRTVAVATGRAARAARDRDNVLGLALMCAAWASRQAADDACAPEHAPDRARARIIYAADVHGRGHLYTNIAGMAHHESGPSHLDPGVCGFLAAVLAEATSSWRNLACPSGTHTRTPLL